MGLVRQARPFRWERGITTGQGTAGIVGPGSCSAAQGLNYWVSSFHSDGDPRIVMLSIMLMGKTLSKRLS